MRDIAACIAKRAHRTGKAADPIDEIIFDHVIIGAEQARRHLHERFDILLLDLLANGGRVEAENDRLSDSLQQRLTRLDADIRVCGHVAPRLAEQGQIIGAIGKSRLVSFDQL